ncbi:hypothetical protein LJR164_004429 [Phenylobacterium sp. LjRoot164]|uniref:hypothetical protein n=1 Tax=unclassified Phenylobacterium TaxID=2640670 RepID=UPI003ECC703C
MIPEGLDDISLHARSFELRAQVKSRHDPQAVFRIDELAEHLAKIADGLPDDGEDVRLALVLERPVHGLVASGWSAPLAASAQDLTVLAARLQTRLSRGSAEALLARIFLVVEEEPIDRLVACLATSSNLALSAARTVAHRLRHAAGEGADQNYAAAAKDAFGLDRSAVQAHIDAVLALVDAAGYAELTGGLCDLADFDAPLPTEGFYSGVDVQPGHVGRGLVFDRPEATGAVLDALAERGAALVAGPSGAGKSAIAWMSAFATRHIVRWYRVRHLSPGDVAKLAQLARYLEATPERPVGFVVDDVGRDATAGWDELFREVKAAPGLLALGTVREEDVLTLETGGQTRTIRPNLDEALAERIFHALAAEGETAFQHWKEPFALSKGLLLEYTHLLTAGRRMEETLAEQVRRRLAEGRGEELLILEVVTVLSAHGAAAEPQALRRVLEIDEVSFARALSRLVDEHALRIQVDGSLQGLHEIRSRHLDAALRERLARPIGELCARALAVARPSDFPTLLPRLLRSWPAAEDPILDTLAERASGADVATVVAVFRGLGLATVERIGSRWVECTRAAGIDDRLSAILFSFELAESDLNLPIFEKLKLVVERFRERAFSDLRTALEARSGRALRPDVLNLSDAHKLLAATLPFRACLEHPSSDYLPDEALAEAPLEPLLAYLTSAHEAGDIGRRAVAAAGGVNHLLERIWRETAWVTRPTLTSYEDQPAVRSDIRLVDEFVQTDLNGEVVAHCTRLAAAAPDAERLLCSIVTADEQVAGFGGFDAASKAMLREYVLDPERIAWNRAHGQAVERLVAADTETDRETACAAAINELEAKLREAGDLYCRMEPASPKWRLFMHVRVLLSSFVKPPSVQDAALDGAQGGSRGDPLYDLVSGIQTLAMTIVDDVDKPLIVAGQAADLHDVAGRLASPSAWRWTAEPPLDALRKIHQHLSDLVSVLEDAHADAGRRRSAALQLQKSTRKYSVLHRAADEARLRAARDHARMKRSVVEACVAKGWDALVVARPSTDTKHRWPDVEFGVFVAVASAADWFELLPHMPAIAEAPGTYVWMSFIPVRDGYALPFGSDWRGQLFPATDPVRAWRADSPVDFLQDDALDHFTTVLEWLVRLSAMSAGRDRDLNAAEELAFEAGAQALSAAFEPFRAALEESDDDELIVCFEVIRQMVYRLDAESKARPDGLSLAAELQAISRSEFSELVFQVLDCRFGLMERALRRTTACRPTPANLLLS